MAQPFPGPEHEPFELGSGPGTAITVHGFPGTPAEVRPLAAALARTGWRVRAPLLPGFGRDWSTLRERRWTDWRAAVAHDAHAASQAGGPVLLIGFSMGAALVLSALADEGVHADGLVLIAPFTRLADRRSFVLPLLKRLVPEFRPYAGVDFDDPHIRTEVQSKVGEANLDDPSVRERLRREVTVPTRAVDEVRKAGLRAYRAATELTPRPTLVVQGGRDTTVTPDTTIELLRRLPGAPLRLFIPDADHRIVLPGNPGHMELLRAVQRFGHERLGHLNAS